MGEVFERLDKIMSQFDDLSAAVASVQSDVRAVSADVVTVIGLLSAPVPQVAAAIAALGQVKSDLDATDASLKAAIPVPPALSVAPGSFALSLSGINTSQLVASGGKSPYTFASSDATIATVSASGLVTGIAAGSVSINVSDSAIPAASVPVAGTVTA